MRVTCAKNLTDEEEKEQMKTFDNLRTKLKKDKTIVCEQLPKQLIEYLFKGKEGLRNCIVYLEKLKDNNALTLYDFIKSSDNIKNMKKYVALTENTAAAAGAATNSSDANSSSARGAGRPAPASHDTDSDEDYYTAEEDDNDDQPSVPSSATQKVRTSTPKAATMTGSKEDPILISSPSAASKSGITLTTPSGGGNSDSTPTGTDSESGSDNRKLPAKAKKKTPPTTPTPTLVEEDGGSDSESDSDDLKLPAQAKKKTSPPTPTPTSDEERTNTATRTETLDSNTTIVADNEEDDVVVDAPVVEVEAWNQFGFGQLFVPIIVPIIIISTIYVVRSFVTVENVGLFILFVLALHALWCNDGFAILYHYLFQIFLS